MKEYEILRMHSPSGLSKVTADARLMADVIGCYQKDTRVAQATR